MGRPNGAAGCAASRELTTFLSPSVALPAPALQIVRRHHAGLYLTSVSTAASTPGWEAQASGRPVRYQLRATGAATGRVGGEEGEARMKGISLS